MKRKEILSRQIDGTLVPIPADQFYEKTAVLGIAVQNGNILIIPQFDGYDFPGGRVEDGEGNTQALLREMKQETGYAVKVLEELCRFTTYYTRHDNGKHYCQNSIIHQVNIVGGGFNEASLTEAEKKYMQSPKWEPFNSFKEMCFKRYPSDCEWADLLQKIENICHNK